jgi:hypothetical protein
MSLLFTTNSKQFDRIDKRETIGVNMTKERLQDGSINGWLEKRLRRDGTHGSWRGEGETPRE